MKLFLKRDETGTGFPSPDQLEVGELVINSKTGKLYSKLTDGTVVEWIGQKICFDPFPIIAFKYNSATVQNIDKFCCAGDNLIVEIDKLKPEPTSYTFSLIELTQNSTPERIIVSDAKYTAYQETVNNVVRNLRKAIVPINLSTKDDNYDNVAIFKFVISDTATGVTISEQVITLKCLEADNND